MLQLSCPLPLEDGEVVTLAHGAGGQHTSRLITELFLAAFNNEELALLHDGALLEMAAGRLVFTTDSFVVQPPFFPGGDIGKLAVTGTLNDLAMCGARPRYLSCGFIIEEGFPLAALRRIVASMKEEAEAHGVSIVAGDTKVVERHGGGNIYINTSGIGIALAPEPINPRRIAVGDSIVISGDIGRHGMAVMAQREGFVFAEPLLSDCAALSPMVEALLRQGITIHCMRDLTRGGLATALVELAEASGMDFTVDEEAIPVCGAVSSACEILGFDPLYVANEGRMALIVPSALAPLTVEVMARHSVGAGACAIGSVVAVSGRPTVLIRNGFNVERPLYRLAGDQLPRIC